MDPLAGWYLGIGEVEMVRRMSPFVRDFLRDAGEEDPSFIESYLLPTLNGEDPEGQILSDLEGALFLTGLEDSGLSGLRGDVPQLGNLGISVNKIKKSVRKLHTSISKKVLPKALQKVDARVLKTLSKVDTKMQHVATKTWKKYGKIILAIVAVIVPFLGPIVAVALVVLSAAEAYYRKKRAADQAKKAAHKDAAKLTAEADQSRAAAEAQLNDFYNLHQKWFIDNLGVTPDKWAQLTFDEKLGLLKSGVSGQPPSGTPVAPPGQPQGPPQQPPGGVAPSGGGGGYAPSGGGGGGGGGYPDGTSSGGGFSPAGGQSVQPVAEAGMFSGAMLPILAAGVALALVFGKPSSGGRRARKNPRRRRRSVA